MEGHMGGFDAKGQVRVKVIQKPYGMAIIMAGKT
jgi:hypothetical protein